MKQGGLEFFITLESETRCAHLEKWCTHLEIPISNPYSIYMKNEYIMVCPQTPHDLNIILMARYKYIQNWSQK